MAISLSVQPGEKCLTKSAHAKHLVLSAFSFRRQSRLDHLLTYFESKQAWAAYYKARIAELNTQLDAKTKTFRVDLENCILEVYRADTHDNHVALRDLNQLYSLDKDFINKELKSITKKLKSCYADLLPICEQLSEHYKSSGEKEKSAEFSGKYSTYLSAKNKLADWLKAYKKNPKSAAIEFKPASIPSAALQEA